MNKISRKLLLSSLSMAFAVVALGTTTFAWFTTNATVTASTKVAVQSSTTSIQISKDCESWGSSIAFDFTDATADGKKELTAWTYNAAAATLSASDTFSRLENGVVQDASTTSANAAAKNNLIVFEAYLKVSSADMNVKLSTDTITAASAKNYTILKDFSFNNDGTTASYKAGDTVKVDVRNSLRAVVDVSSGVSTTSADYTALGTGAHKAFVDDAASYTRINKVAGYKADSVGSIGTPGTTDMVNFGKSMANDNCANSYIAAVLGSEFFTRADDSSTPDVDESRDNKVNAKYAAIAQTENGFTNTTLVEDTDTDTIYKVRFTYWLEGFDADCFDAVFGQTFDLAYTFDMAQNA